MIGRAGRAALGGGFSGAPDPGMWAYTSSLAVDRRLWRQDVAGSRAHVRGLVAGRRARRSEEGKLLLDGLAQVAGELAAAGSRSPTATRTSTARSSAA